MAKGKSLVGTIALLVALFALIIFPAHSAYSPYYSIEQVLNTTVSGCSPPGALPGCASCNGGFRTDCNYYFGSSPLDCPSAYPSGAKLEECVYFLFREKTPTEDMIPRACALMQTEDSRFLCFVSLVPEYGKAEQCALISGISRNAVGQRTNCYTAWALKNSNPAPCGNIEEGDMAIDCCLRTKYPAVGQYPTGRKDLLDAFTEKNSAELSDCRSIAKIKAPSEVPKCEDVNCDCLAPCNGISGTAQNDCAKKCSLEYVGCYDSDRTEMPWETRERFLQQSFYGLFTRKQCDHSIKLPDFGSKTETGERSFPWIIVAGGAAALAAGAALVAKMLSDKSAGDKSKGKDAKGYVLQLNPQSLTIAPGTKGTIEATVWKVSKDGGYSKDSGAEISISPEDGLVARPSSGTGGVKATVSAGKDADAGKYAVEFSATPSGARSITGTAVVEVTDKTVLELTYPAGKSPNVFTRGWVFGAKAIVSSGKGKEEDVSDKVEWSGTGTFSPARGSQATAEFEQDGANTIELSVETPQGKTIKKKFPVKTVSPDGYAKLGDMAKCQADAHGCPACPHPTIGPIRTGSPIIKIDGRPAARKGDEGIHAACCGPNSYVIAEGDPQVLIDGRPAAKKGSRTAHCGGSGRIVKDEDS